MPMYEYECAGCRQTFEFIQKFSDPPMTECESCGGALSKLLSAPSFQLTGGGWYADGYADKKPAASSGDDGAKGAAKSGGKDAGGSSAGATKGKKSSSKKAKGAGSDG